MTNSFIDEVREHFQHLGIFEGAQSSFEGRMAKALIAVDELCNKWEDGHTEEEACAEQIRNAISEATRDDK